VTTGAATAQACTEADQQAGADQLPGRQGIAQQYARALPRAPTATTPALPREQAGQEGPAPATLASAARRLPAAIPLIPATRPRVASNSTAAAPINAPPATAVHGRFMPCPLHAIHGIALLFRFI
jgi:hypothetical protein